MILILFLLLIMTSVIINVLSSKPIIIIDQSYYIFNRYFATISWFKRKSPEMIITEEIVNEDEFILAFFRHFENDIKKLLKKFKTIKTNIIFSGDCSRSDIWRNEIYDCYKSTRAKKTNFNNKIFVMFRQFIYNHNYNYCEYEKLEADDITYILQKHLKTNCSSVPIVIITNDSDYLQMYDKRVNIINMQFKDLSLKMKNMPSVDLEFKIIFGDKSDNIPKIQTGLNKEKAFKLALMDKEERNKYLEENDLLDKYNLNKKLIDLEEIPENLIIEFFNKYNIIIKK